MFWPGLQPIQGALRRQLRIAFENDIALYSAHFPLDIHPKIGNNAQLVAALGLKSAQPFLEEKGQPVGLKVRASLPRSELVRKLQKVLNGPVKVFGFGPKQTRAIGVVTGAAGSEIYRVADEGIDTFITGEAPHWAAVAAEEARRESPPRRTLRDGSFRRESARCAFVETIRNSMGIHRLPNWIVRESA